MFAQNTGDGTGGSTENKINRLKIVFRPKHIYIYFFFSFWGPLGKKINMLACSLISSILQVDQLRGKCLYLKNHWC